MNLENEKVETITLGAGCFWCIEAVFQQLKGVKAVISGYTGGKIKNPTYREVCSGLTGHAEVAQISFDPSLISFKDILEVFWKSHDPTTLNKQGADVGTQYRSAIFYHTEEQKKIAEEFKDKLNHSGIYSNPVVTEISPLKEFYEAENYHQNYFKENPGQPYCQLVVRPKVKKIQQLFEGQLKTVKP